MMLLLLLALVGLLLYTFNYYALSLTMCSLSSRRRRLRSAQMVPYARNVLRETQEEHTNRNLACSSTWPTVQDCDVVRRVVCAKH